MSDKSVVTVVNQGARFWLRGTTWAFGLDRADRFDSAEAALAAIKRAAKFNPKAARRAEVWDEATAARE